MRSENKRELLQTVFNNESAERVPVGFWWHFLSGSELIYGYQKNDIVTRLVAEHKKMYDQFKPDFMKIMSDGFFAHPALVEANASSLKGFRDVKPIGRNHSWISKQVELVRAVSSYVGKDIMTFYNMFSPLQALRLNIKYLGVSQEVFQNLIIDYPEEAVRLSKVIAEDYKILAEELKRHTSVDGIYYSVQNIQDARVDADYQSAYVKPTELDLLNELNQLWDYSILHICGYDHFKNKLEYYQDYPATAYNWAVHTDCVSLKEGKKMFNAPVIGGFDNNKGTLLDVGSDAEVSAFVEDLINDTGRAGLIIGADCTIPSDVAAKRFNFVRGLPVNRL